MADEIENPTRVSNSFKVPKRNLNIGGIDKKNRPFNARFNRPIKKSEELSKLMINGIIKSVELGSKNCFFVKELSETDKADLLAKLNVEEKFSQLRYSEYEIAENGWWTINTVTKDGIKPCKELVEAIDAYHSYNDPENKNCLTMYGEVTLNVDFSKLDLVQEEDGGVSYPYGILFFSDSKSFVNQFAAKCAVFPRRLEQARNNPYIRQIEDWENATIKGSFRSTGHFVIFYVKEQDGVEVGNGDVKLFPKVHMITIETILNRGENGLVTGVGIGKVEESEVLADHYKENEGDPFGSEIAYLVENAFAKYSTQSNAASHFAKDYIYLVGDDPRFYDLSALNVDPSKNPADKAAGDKKDKKPSNNKKHNKNNKPKNNNKQSVNEPKQEKTADAVPADVKVEEETPVDVEVEAKPEAPVEEVTSEPVPEAVNETAEPVKVEDSLITEVAAESENANSDGQ